MKEGERWVDCTSCSPSLSVTSSGDESTGQVKIYPIIGKLIKFSPKRFYSTLGYCGHSVWICVELLCV